MRRFCAVLAAQWFALAPSLHAQEATLTRLPKEARSPFLAFKNSVLGSSSNDANLAGWLVLNGARFANSEYPDLARAMREIYQRQGVQVSDPDFTRLPAEKIATDLDGRAVQGVAICPSRLICGDLVGTIMPFKLDASL